MHATIYQIIRSPQWAGNPGLELAQSLFFDWYMEGNFEDRDYAVRRYRRYCDDVRKTVPSRRLRVYTVTEGWAPLCNLFGSAVPDRPFPRHNTREQFRRQL